ncbi:MAG: hypothetical protein AMXMBFR7_32960 [Planctomycetota bacterium]
MPAEFKDREGRVWRPRISVDVLIDYEQRTGVGLLSTAGGDIFAGKLGHVLTLAYLACEEQAKAYGLNFDTFCAEVFAPETMEPMAQAIAEAVRDFFPSPTPVQGAPRRGNRGPGAPSTK